MRVTAEVTLAPGKGKVQRYTIARIEGYQITQALDLDADTFSVDIGDSEKQLKGALDRDTEIRVDLFFTEDGGARRQVFSGIADQAQYSTNHILSVTGRDTPSVVMDTDAQPGRWKRVKPQQFLKGRARSIGLTKVNIPTMKEVPVIFTDATEKEWAFWYRIVRGAGMYMWATNTGELTIDHLAYSPTQFAYSFGHKPQNASAKNADWIAVADVVVGSTKQSRIYQSIIYGDDAKKGAVRIGRSHDPRIQNWRRKATVTNTTTTVKTQAKMNEDAKLEIFEGIVGDQEHVLQIRDTGTPIERNRMCRVNMPDYGLVGHFFIVGVTRQGGQDAFTQIIRLREKSFALSKRVPDAPTLDTSQQEPDPTTVNKPVGAISTALDDAGVPYGASFLRAAQEYGVPAGWNLSTFAAVLMAIGKTESGFRNVREGGDVEWYARPVQTYGDAAGDAIFGRDAGTGGENKVRAWEKEFANAKGNPDNPYAGRVSSNGEAGVGVMQLTSLSLKQTADDIAFADHKQKKGELEGGRWDPDSNIREAAKYLVDCLKAVGADPTKPETIWVGVGAYHTGPGNAGSSAASNYAAKVKQQYSTFLTDTTNAITETQALPVGSAIRTWKVPGHGTIEAPDGTPPQVAKAITWALSMYGDPYLYGGPKPNEYHFDCSSFVMGAYVFTSSELRAVMDGPTKTSHGNESTYTLIRDGRFQAIAKDDLKPGDWVWSSAEHMGMFIGDGLIIEDPHSHDSVKVIGLGEFGFYAARRVVPWPVGGALTGVPKAGTPAGSSGPGRVVMLQAGHDPGSHGDQPFGHSGETGAPGEVEFTRQVRDLALAFFAKDPRFTAIGGDAWDGSSGASGDPGDDINVRADVFLAIHYDIAAGESRFFFGWPTGEGSTVQSNSANLAAKIAARYQDVPGHPDYTPSRNNSNGALTGYYSWSHTTAAYRVLIECGAGGSPDGTDRPFLITHQREIAGAIYQGICDTFGLKPQP